MNKITPDSPPVANSAYQQLTLPATLHFLHLAAFSPTKTTWLRAIRKNHFTTWPNLTVKNVHKHLPHNINTILGHLDQQRQNICSTKSPPLPETPPDNDYQLIPEPLP